MPKFLIERELPNAGALSPEELQGVAIRSNAALRQLGPDIQWRESYVTADKITCVYLATDEEIVREHARLGDFPATRVLEIGAIIDPATAEAKVHA